MNTIRAQVVPTRELFRDDESGFKIYSADVKESDGEIVENNYGNISIKGNNLPDFNLGATYDLELVRNPRDKYKGSYSMFKSHFVKPQTAEEQWKFLKMVVTEIQYNEITQYYSVGEDKIIDIIIDGEFEYSKIRGYGLPTYEKLKEKVSDNLNISEALAYFSEYDISYNTIKRVVVAYGSSERAIEEIEKNPYAIIDKRGFGFLKADDLAMKIGIPRNSPHRIKSCMLYILDEANEDGDVWVSRKKLYNKMKKTLKVNKEDIDAIIDTESDEVFVWGDRYATQSIVQDELYLSAMLAKKAMLENPLLKDQFEPSEFIEKFETENNLTLSDKQAEFIYSISKSNVIFLIGNAGSGKSLSMKAVVDIAETLGLRYALLSPTGKASRVLTEYTGKQAYTIHKHIGYGGHNEVDSIPEDIIIVDEASMCDINIATKLMSVVKEGSLVVFVGDDAQIPSVGVGNFLFDCIHNDSIPQVKLDKVFRQKESGLLDAITMTRQGKAFLNTTLTKSQRLGNNFEFRHMIKEHTVENLVKSYTKMIKSGYKYDKIGVLVPTNVGEVGAIEINRAIQEVVNPQSVVNPKDEHTFGNSKTQRTFRVGDYVMNTENMYDAPVVNKANTIDVFNGECGVIIAVNEGNKEIIVDFEGNHVLYSISEAVRKLNHAWAITIHKSQGSQYDVVLAVVDSSATYQLNANLLYTAMSRAKKFLGVFGQATTYNRALKKFANFDRQSFLNEFLDISFKAIKDNKLHSLNAQELSIAVRDLLPK